MSETWWMVGDTSLMVGAVAAMLLTAGVLRMGAARLVGGLRPVYVTEVVDCCCVWQVDDFDVWESELDPDQSDPVVVVGAPASDEELLDVAEVAGVVAR